MGDIHYLTLPISDIADPKATDYNTARQVIQVDFVQASIKRAESPVFIKIQTLLRCYNIDFDQQNIQKDFDIIKQLVQAMMDRSNGRSQSSACLILDALRLTMGYDEEPKEDDTEKLFGDLLDKID